MNICERGQDCSCFVDYIFGSYIGHCCKRHDRRYENKRLSKFQADILLFRCVKKQGHPIVAGIMFVGVSLFGHNNYKKANNELM